MLSSSLKCPKDGVVILKKTLVPVVFLVLIVSSDLLAAVLGAASKQFTMKTLTGNNQVIPPLRASLSNYKRKH